MERKNDFESQSRSKQLSNNSIGDKKVEPLLGEYF